MSNYGAQDSFAEFPFRHHLKVPELPPDVVLGLPWLRSYNLTVNWKERYADVQHGSTPYRLSFRRSSDCTRLHFQAAPKWDLLWTLSSTASELGMAGSPAAPAKEQADLCSWTHNKRDVHTLNDFEMEDGITDEECSDM